MPERTPLLLLLDGILSQSEERAQPPLVEITRLLRESDVHLILPHPDISLTRSAANLLAVLEALLSVQPELVSFPSQRDGSLPLHFAASLGNVQVASLLLGKYPQAASTPNKNSKIPLHYAAREGHTDMVDFLVRSHPATAQITTKKQKLPLHFAAGDGHTDIVQILLGAYPQGASQASAKGKFPLHFAARWGHLQIAKDLLRVYPDCVSAMDWDGSLPLHDAARQGQCAMAEFLVEGFPQALATANLRGEIPLFPAVRSGNLDMVVFFVQSWPAGGKHILMNVSADDDVCTWKWEVVELLLRGAADNFADCDLLKGKELPRVRLANDFGIIAACPLPDPPESSSSDGGYSSKMRSRVTTTHIPHMPAVPIAAKASALNVAIPRSKSPVLDSETASRKKRTSSGHGCERKRARLESFDTHDDDSCATDSLWGPMVQQRTFIALHAALECGASSQVVGCVLDKHAAQVEEMDDLGRLPLHLAAARCKTVEEAELFVERILKPHPQAALQRDARNRLPLHIAIATRANVLLVEALLEANPMAGVEACRTNDDWCDEKPMDMACHCDCDLAAVYLLLRADPSSLPSTEVACGGV